VSSSAPPAGTPSYAHGVGAKPLLGETIGANLERTAARYPDREAIVSCHQRLRLSYAEFDAQVDQLARGLMAAGLGIGDRVGIWSPNRVEWALVQYATAKAGAILVNVNPAYRVHELRYALAQSGCKMLIAAAQTKTGDYRTMVDEVRAELPDLERSVFFDTDSWDELLAGADAAAVRERDRVGDRGEGQIARAGVDARVRAHPRLGAGRVGRGRLRELTVGEQADGEEAGRRRRCRVRCRRGGHAGAGRGDVRVLSGCVGGAACGCGGALIDAAAEGGLRIEKSSDAPKKKVEAAPAAK